MYHVVLGKFPLSVAKDEQCASEVFGAKVVIVKEV